MALAQGQRLRVLLGGMQHWQAEVLRDLLCTDGGLDVICVTRDARETIRCATAHEPDVVVLNFYLHDLSGFETLHQLRAAAPASRVVILGDDDTEPYQTAARRAGASAYLPWVTTGSTLVGAVRGAAWPMPGVVHAVAADASPTTYE